MIKDLYIVPNYNSRGERTLKVFLKTENGIYSGCAPSGKSRGKHEAKTLDINKILNFFPKFKENFLGMDESDHEAVDQLLEELGIGRIGANLSIAISIACLKAASENKVYKFLNPNARIFPFPISNIIGGGMHGGYTSIQEFLVIPKKSKTIEDAIKTNISIWKEVRNNLMVQGFFAGKNDEGALVSRLDDLKSLDLLSKIAESHEASIGVDFASSKLYKNGIYNYLHLGKKFDSKEQLDFVEQLIKTYKLVYVEDPFQEDDFQSFSELTKKVDCMIIGDDLFATQHSRLKEGIKNKAGNGIIIKPDQVGTISKTLETVKIAKRNNYATIISHRSGETCETIISDLAVAIEAPLIKCGIVGGERIVKLNRLIELWNSSEKSVMTKIKLNT